MHSKSKEAFKHNVRAEMHAGKPQKQALAIAYSEQQRSRKGKKKKKGTKGPHVMEHSDERVHGGY
jgi:hypothetical protein